MRMRTLGRTGIKVSAYCLGTMAFGQVGGPDLDECIGIVHAALDAGVNFIDTADVYSGGSSEKIVGQALRGRRDRVILATKAHFPMPEDPNSGGNSRRWIVRAIEDSLRRLQTEYVDLYQIHQPDPETDIDETLSALSDLVRSGQVRAIGSSAFPAEQIVEAQWVADRRGHARFRSEQVPYSILVRGAEAAVLPTCQRYGMGAIAHSPLAGGWLTGRRRAGTAAGPRLSRAGARSDPSSAGNAAKLVAVEKLAKLAADTGCQLSHLALGFVAAHPAVTSVVIGPHTASQLIDLLDSSGLRLDDRTLDTIDLIVPPGVTLDLPDAAWQPPALTDPSQRRRSQASRR